MTFPSLFSLTALLLLSTQVHAWWDGPWNGMMEGWFDVGGNTHYNINSATALPGYAYHRPYYKGAQSDVSPEFTSVEHEHLKQGESRQQAILQAITAQRQLAEQFAAQPR